MKNLIIIGILLFLPAFFYSCSDSGSTVTPGPGNPLKGVYVLYEGSSINTDYAYYDVSSGDVTNNVFAMSNSGLYMQYNPGDMKINSNRHLYITCRGTNDNNGKIYKINADDNHLISSVTQVNNPYGFVINNSDLILSNLSADYVTRYDTDLNLLLDSIPTGPMPAHILYAFNRYIVCKSSLTPGQSLAAINESSFNVDIYDFDFTPVSSTYNVYGYFISSYTRKTIYRLDEEDLHKIDSIVLPTSFGFIGDIFKKSGNTFYVIAGNKEVWEVSPGSAGELTAGIKISQANGLTISGGAYDISGNEIFVSDNNDGLLNGELHIYDASNGQLKSTIPLGGKNPTQIAFRY